jgi:hypothetical protein
MLRPMPTSPITAPSASRSGTFVVDHQNGSPRGPGINSSMSARVIPEDITCSFASWNLRAISAG